MSIVFLVNSFFSRQKAKDNHLSTLTLVNFRLPVKKFPRNTNNIDMSLLIYFTIILSFHFLNFVSVVKFKMSSHWKMLVTY